MNAGAGFAAGEGTRILLAAAARDVKVPIDVAETLAKRHKIRGALRSGRYLVFVDPQALRAAYERLAAASGPVREGFGSSSKDGRQWTN
jgi:hypothetical protein